ncbi:CaiB/BaiF CoA transferase family protein [Sphingorhabdus sp. SMR4y]|uniref:CaiB/BaiF CoA transferase family protein n=1 Tax=Sphingorhabdus sp. SMR4y TaxID=2584094 RepID=UPI000B5CCBC4|nr:CoA transferase [Sphingorhabdus sp. SMR4y]ASK88876.1 acetyl-CoA:oxalate CoA-transferase [Sphingorhabdus sp. SMR4y]
MSAKQPLKGFRVLSAEQYGAGPYGTMFLAQLGADVIKIEPPKGGDTARHVGPHWLREQESLYFQSFNLNKRSLTLDLRSDEGIAILHKLVRNSHVMANNLRGDVPAKIGLDYESLKTVNPAIVCAHVSAYGRDNERAKWPGYDYLMQAEAGFCALTGEPDGPPVRFGLSMVDFMSGTQMAVGLLAALLDAQRSGEGCDVDVDLLSAAVHQTSYPALWYMNEGDVTSRVPRGAHPSATPSQMFKAADGWMFIMAQLPKFWTILCERIGQQALITDPRFDTPANRLTNRTELSALLDGIFSTRPIAHWMELLQGEMPVSPVYELDQALDNPWLETIGMRDTVSHPDRPEMDVLSSPIKLNGERLPNRAGPLLGADNDSILGEIGYDADAIAELRAGGVI